MCYSTVAELDPLEHVFRNVTYAGKKRKSLWSHSCEVLGSLTPALSRAWEQAWLWESELSRWLLWDIITCWKLNMCLNMCFCRTEPLWVTSVLPHTLQIEINPLQTTASSLDEYMGWSDPSDCSMNKHVQNGRTSSCTQFPFRDCSSLQSKSHFIFIVAPPLVKCSEISNHKEEQEF